MREGEIGELKRSPEASDLRWRGHDARSQPIIVFDAERDQHRRQFILPKPDRIGSGFPPQIVNFQT